MQHICDAIYLWHNLWCNISVTQNIYLWRSVGSCRDINIDVKWKWNWSRSDKYLKMTNKMWKGLLWQIPDCILSWRMVNVCSMYWISSCMRINYENCNNWAWNMKSRWCKACCIFYSMSHTNPLTPTDHKTLLHGPCALCPPHPNHVSHQIFRFALFRSQEVQGTKALGTLRHLKIRDAPPARPALPCGNWQNPQSF